MRNVLIVAGVAVLLAATSGCGGSKKTADKPMPPAGGGAGTAVAPPTGGTTYGGGAMKPPEGGGAAGALTDAQCKEMFQHVYDVVVKEHPEAKAQMDEGMKDMDNNVKECKEKATAKIYDCFMKAQTTNDLQGCGT